LSSTKRLPFLVPLASEDVLQSSQSSQGDQDFHLVGGVHNDAVHLKSGANVQFFQVISCHGWCDERGLNDTGEFVEDVASFKAACRHSKHAVRGVVGDCHLRIVSVHFALEF
jgi:hypothetical protein